MLIETQNVLSVHANFESLPILPLQQNGRPRTALDKMGGLDKHICCREIIANFQS